MSFIPPTFRTATGRDWFSIDAHPLPLSLIERIFPDAGYQGPRAARAAASTGRWVLEIVKRNEMHKFIVLPKRWIVERTLAWIAYNRQARSLLNSLRADSCDSKSHGVIDPSCDHKEESC